MFNLLHLKLYRGKQVPFIEYFFLLQTGFLGYFFIIEFIQTGKYNKYIMYLHFILLKKMSLIFDINNV